MKRKFTIVLSCVMLLTSIPIYAEASKNQKIISSVSGADAYDYPVLIDNLKNKDVNDFPEDTDYLKISQNIKNDHIKVEIDVTNLMNYVDSFSSIPLYDPTDNDDFLEAVIYGIDFPSLLDKMFAKIETYSNYVYYFFYPPIEYIEPEPSQTEEIPVDSGNPFYKSDAQLKYGENKKSTAYWNKTASVHVNETMLNQDEFKEYPEGTDPSTIKKYAVGLINYPFILEHNLYITNDASSPAPITIEFTQGKVNRPPFTPKEVVASYTIEPGQTIKTDEIDMKNFPLDEALSSPSIILTTDVVGDYTLNISTEDPQIYN